MGNAAEHLIEVWEGHAARLGARLGLLPTEVLAGLDELEARPLADLGLAALSIDGEGRVARANPAALETFRLATSGPLQGGREADGVDALIGRPFFGEVCPSANCPLLRRLLRGDQELNHLLPYTLVGPRGRLDVLLQVVRQAPAAGVWFLARGR